MLPYLTGCTTQVVSKEINISRLLEQLDTWGWSCFRIITSESHYLSFIDLIMNSGILKAEQWPKSMDMLQTFANIFCFDENTQTNIIKKKISGH